MTGTTSFCRLPPNAQPLPLQLAAAVEGRCSIAPLPPASPLWLALSLFVPQTQRYRVAAASAETGVFSRKRAKHSQQSREVIDNSQQMLERLTLFRERWCCLQPTVMVGFSRLFGLPEGSTRFGLSPLSSARSPKRAVQQDLVELWNLESTKSTFQTMGMTYV